MPSPRKRQLAKEPNRTAGDRGARWSRTAGRACGDLWSPWGDGDLLGRAALLACRAGARRDQDLAAALEVATLAAAAVLDLDRYGLEPGCAADLALVPAATLGEAVVAHPPRSLVIKAGRVVSRDGDGR